ncbi:MAG: hypothetical protein Ct9H300mP32_2760 [Verrucomicrobiota bacterium]|nr:MAG: hypothetical protein Ct9H300mP32_2760 [Verrucomicrobiota bacterium]
MSLPTAIQPDDATHVCYRGKRLIYFGGCDYYRLSRHPKLLKAHAQAAAHDGLGTGASRMTTGNHPAHDELEASLVKFFGCETAPCHRRRLPCQHCACPSGQRPV